MLNRVSVARRKRVSPPATTTSRIRASPACAPSANPTSCDSDAGVHKSVRSEEHTSEVQSQFHLVCRLLLEKKKKNKKKNKKKKKQKKTKKKKKYKTKT